MIKPIFSNKKVTSENNFLRTIQRDFIDSQNRKGNIITLEGVSKNGGSFIFALTKEKKVILNKEYKFGPDRYIYTFPSGWIDIEDEKQNALNELEEETGYSTNDEIIYIGETIQNGYIVGMNKMFFVTNCFKKGKAFTHEGEEIYTELLDLDTLHKMVINGDILDPYTIVNYFLVKEKTNNFTNV